MRKARTIALTAGALTAALVAAAATTAPAATAATAQAGRAAPATPSIGIKPGVHQLPQVAARATPWTTALCESLLNIACYGPDQIRAAYNEAPLFSKGITGTGATIVIVDSFGSPTIKADLSTFDAQFGYPDPPSFNIIAPAGGDPPVGPEQRGHDRLGLRDHAGRGVRAHGRPWREHPAGGDADRGDRGRDGLPRDRQGRRVRGRPPPRRRDQPSFSATEQTFTSYAQLAPLRAAYLDAFAHGVTVLAATGDDGAANPELDGSTLYTTPTTGWPGTDPLVTAVGGTQLQESTGGTFSSVVWNDTYDVPLQEAFTGTDGPNPFATGGGVSEFFKRPIYQIGVARVTGPMRGCLTSR